MLNKITKKVDILDNNGVCINPGYCFKYLFNYNRENIKARESRIKEWEFYQFIEDDYVMQFTIGYASIFDSYSFNFFNIKTGVKYEFGKLRLHKKGEIIYPNPEESFNLSYSSKKFNICFKNDNGKRHIIFNTINKRYGNVSANVFINGDLKNEKMCILTPFKESKYQFYLNYKENYYDCVADINIGKEKYEFKNLKGLVDSGRGYWPFKQDWVWSSLTNSIDGHDFGWNLGFGFGDLSHATENMIFFDHKGIQLGELDFEIDFENQSTKPILIKDKNGIFEAKLEPIFDNYTETNFIWIRNKCHQVFYKASGYVLINNKKYNFKNIKCFLEHAKNRW